MIIKKTKRNLVIMLIGILLVFILSFLNAFDFYVVPIWIFIIGFIIILYLFYHFKIATENRLGGYNSKRTKFLFACIDYLSVLVYVVIIVQLVFNFVLFPATVKMSSMNPVLFENDRLIVFNGNKNIKRFEIVVFEIDSQDHPLIDNELDGDLWVKRVIGLPGEEVHYLNGQLYINGLIIDEPDEYYNNYQSTPNFNMEDILKRSKFENEIIEGNIIPEGYYLLLGDNRGNSVDSYDIGLIHKDHIVGEARYKINGLLNFKKIGG